MPLRPDTSPIPEDPQRQEFCHYLRRQREARQMSLVDIANITRIPERSLRWLECGRFEELPADVFVRGFLRSYARCVGLDAEEAVRRYALCGLSPAPAAAHGALDGGASATATPTAADGEAPRMARGSDASALVAGEAADDEDHPYELLEITGRPDDSAAVEAPRLARRARTFLPPGFLAPDDEPRRGPITLGVIILVIVATLAMSYLLRRPSYSGDGITRHTPATETTAPGQDRDRRFG